MTVPGGGSRDWRRERGLGWKQRAVLRLLESDREVHEDIQRVVAVACGYVRKYAMPSDTQKVMRGLITRGLVERVGPNGYRAVSRG